MEYESTDSTQVVILIIDNQEENLEILTEILASNYQVRTARQGKHALEIASSQQSRPHIILLNMLMLKINGSDLFTRLRAQPESADIPVIFIAPSHNPQDEEAAFARGVADYLSEPLRPSVVLARVRMQLSMRRLRNELVWKSGLRAQQLEERTKELEEYQHRLLHADKMASIGLLAGGIAHNFNNILTPIIGYCELLLADLRSGHRWHGEIQQIFLAGLRAKDMVGKLLTFARKDKLKLKREPLSVVLVAEETLRLLQAGLPPNVEMRRNFDEQAVTAMVSADSSQLQSILMNLCTNAVYAMRDTGGVLSVEITMAREEDAAFLRSHQMKTPALRLKISDTGEGLDEAIRHRVFEPYFTTKPPGEGTGLGLSMVYGIVMDLGGVIDITSEVGAGSAFSIYLPLCEENAVLAVPVKNVGSLKDPVGKLAMFVDSDEAILKVGRRFLERLGMRVETYATSGEALDRFRRGPNEFDLLITGQLLATITGTQLAQKITSLRPDLPVILCTGNPRTLTLEELWDAGINVVLPKPFQGETLFSALRQLGMS